MPCPVIQALAPAQSLLQCLQAECRVCEHGQLGLPPRWDLKEVLPLWPPTDVKERTPGTWEVGRGEGGGPHVWTIHTIIIAIIITVGISFKFPATEISETYVVFILPMRKLRWRQE